MKKTILLALCLFSFCFKGTAQVRKDTLVLDDNISLKMEYSYAKYGRTVILDSIYSDAPRDIMLHLMANPNIKIANFYSLGYEINSNAIRTSKKNQFDIYVPRQILYMGVRGVKGVKGGNKPLKMKPKYKPQYANIPLVMRYIKNGKAYYITIPINELNINRSNDEVKCSLFND